MGALKIRPHTGGWDRLFLSTLGAFLGGYLLLIVAMLVADATFTTPAAIGRALEREELRYAFKLSFLSSTASAILSVGFAIPIGYLLSRTRFPGKPLIEGILDIPIVLPPMVIGLSLLILFQTVPGQWIERYLPVTYEIPSIILAQFTVACAFAIRAMRVTFDQIDPRQEEVAWTLGCSRRQAFWQVVLPEAGRGVLTAGMLAWARALGEFGPILVFSGATRMKTEVLPSTVFLELSIGDLEAAVAVSLVMVSAALIVLVLTRTIGLRGGGIHP